MKKLTKYPWLNALLAILYIVVLVLLMWGGSLETAGKNFSLVMPMVMIAIFTLSAAVMGYLFLAQPLMLYLDGKKKEAVSFFLRTVSVFAGIVLIGYVVMMMI